MHTGGSGQQQFFVPCGSKLLRKTDRKGGESRLFAYSVDSTPSLHALDDLEPGSVAVFSHIRWIAHLHFMCWMIGNLALLPSFRIFG